MGKRRSLVRQVLDRFDSLMATGESRYEAKRTARQTAHEAGQPAAWSVSDGRIHAFRTRKGYQAITLRLLHWSAAQGKRFRSLEELDAQAEALVAAYLQAELAAGKSAWTLQTERSAPRLFFGRRDLAAGVTLPPRRRAAITRSRRPAARDATFDPAHWRDLLTFLEATGLRRSEVARIHARDVVEGGTGRGDGDAAVGLVACVKGKGGKWRLAPVLPTFTEAVRAIIAEKPPDARLFPRIPSHLDIHAARRRYAQATYRAATDGRDLPPTEGRLPRGAVDPTAARSVSRALGHNRLDVTTTHYLR